MALVREVVKKTGIFQTVRVRPATNDPESAKDFFDNAFRAWQIEKNLAEYGEHCLTILAKYKCNTFVRFDTAAKQPIYEERSVTEFPHQILDDAPPIAHDARNVMHTIHCLRIGMTKNRIRDSVVHAIALGASLVRLQVRPFESYVVSGRKVIEGGRRVTSARTGPKLIRPTDTQSIKHQWIS
ncbi:MAG TPA: hypothetical protein VJZ71_08270 [Phycisphaerae bacterium]|nr:hypothetical protein [Phycisphaerae bacterium]